jgi:hypothetical protein
MLTFVVVGSGFAGVETVGAINDLVRESLPHYGRVDPRELRVVLIGRKTILPELGEALGVYAQEKLGIPKLLEIGEAMEALDAMLCAGAQHTTCTHGPKSTLEILALSDRIH